jgi:CheY-like chemotaxis protein
MRQGTQPAVRILLVDDDGFIRRYAAEMLTQLGHEVLAVGSGLEALDAIRRGESFDLLFTDIVMPGGINGRELVAAARRERPGLPVLYTSGYRTSDIVRLTRNDPSALLLEKPYRRVDLARAVAAALATPDTQSQSLGD